MSKRLLTLAMAMLCVTLAKASFAERTVVKNGVVYLIEGSSIDEAYAIASYLANDFTGTSVVLEDFVEAIWIESEGGGGFIPSPRRRSESITINVPVTNMSFSSSQIKSLTLGKCITRGDDFWGVRYYLNNFDNLEEILVKEGNEKYSSNQGLLCNAVGDSLLYVPKKSYQINGDTLTVPIGIHYDVSAGDYSYSYYGVKRVRYLDELYYWPSMSSSEMWFEKNLTPPEGYPGSGYSYDVILHIPVGCLDAYSSVGVQYILEEGANIDVINKDLKGSGFYDVDGDGELDVINHSSSFSIQDALEVYQSPNNDNLTYRWGYWTNDELNYGNIAYKGEDGNIVNIVNRSGFQVLYEDIDGDGLRDCISGYPSKSGEKWMVSKQMSDGSFVTIEQAVFDEDDYKDKSGLPSLRDGMFLDSGGSSTLTTIDIAKDVNGDGILDLMDSKNGGILYSNGDNQWMKYSTKTLIWPCDIDDDGQEDLIIYDGEAVSLITDRYSASPNQKELFRGTKVEKVLIKDFDKDGDLDILLHYTIEGSYNSPNYTHYFIFLRNNGNGTFRKKESNFVDYCYTLLSCGDYDNDGLYELAMFSSRWIDNASYRGKLLKINSDLTVTEHPESFVYGGESGSAWRKPVFGDFDNDGWTEWYANIGIGTLYGHLNSQTTRNTAPQKMATPTAILQPETGLLKISWQRGQDQETSACDLTYELRIGTQPGQGNVLCAASLEDGRRRTLREGEMGMSLYKLFNANTLKPGKYYIAVQAIDAGGLGGVFSDDFVYIHQPTSPSFTFDIQKPATADVVNVNLKAVYPDATYEWILSEGEVLEQNETGAKLQFHQMGSHTVGVTMTLDGVAYKSEVQEVFVDAAKGDGNGGVSLYDSYIFFDANQDGYPECVGYQNDGLGNLTKVPLSLYSESLGGVRFISDYNLDGYPDFVTGGCSKGNVFINYGEQDFDFDNMTVDASFPYGDYMTDFNNDGRADLVGSEGKPYYSSYDAGDGLTYNSMEAIAGYDSWFYDVNRDGFLDIVTQRGGDLYGNDEVWTVRYKSNTSEMEYGEEQELFRIPIDFLIKEHIMIYSTSKTNGMLADMNNDGVVDLVFPSDLYNVDDSVLYIMKGVANGVANEVIKVSDVGYINSLYYISFAGIRDIDNDGYLDILLGSGSNDPAYYVVHMNKEGEFVSTKVNVNTNIYTGDIWMVLKDGGYPQTSNSKLEGSIRNAKPAAPAAVAAKQTADGLLITWADAMDDHTPAVQMRYNVSVKRKGKTGSGAYVISPMNGGSDVATIVSNYIYKQSTQMLIPANVLTAGETYEIRVQAIDLWNEVSPMSNVIEYTMTGGGYLDIPERTTTNKETTIKYIGASAASYTLQPGEGGTILQDKGNGEYVVTWSTEGMKEVTLIASGTQVKSSVIVVKALDLAFDVPAMVLAGAPLEIAVSPDMAAETTNVGWRCDDPKVQIEYTPGAKKASVLFPKVGSYVLEAYSTDSIRSNSYQRTIIVSDVMPEAAVQRVNADGANYSVQWDASSLPSFIDKVVVLREGNSLNQFIELTEVDASQGHFMDLSSNANVVSNRYAIKLVASSGQVSDMSEIHKPLHVMIGLAAAGGYNLMWNNYEGLVVDNYQIWRGSSESAMELYAQVAGSQQSYTDLEPLAGITYYAIVFNPQMQTGGQAPRRAGAGGEGAVHSNYVSTQNANSLVLAQSIEIINGSGLELTDDCPEVRLYCTLLPAYCSINKVAWSIVEGNDVATIDSDGRLRAIGKGSVKVRATTIDGSNLSAEITVICNIGSSLKGDVNDDGKVDINDALFIVNYILDNSLAGFNADAADVDGDGEITIADAVGVMNIILNK